MDKIVKPSDLVVLRDGAVFILEMRRPPNNFIDEGMVADLVNAVETLDADTECRAIVLASEGKHFCAGAELAKRAADTNDGLKKHIYDEAHRLVRGRKPIIAAIQGAAVGAGLGLALIADFRVGCAEARFSANFNRQGYHPGFGMTFTLPRVVGAQHAAWLFYSGRRIDGDEARAMGLIDRLVPLADVRTAALDMAQEIATSGPLAVQATRLTLRGNFEAMFREAVGREIAAQDILKQTEDFKEGVKAMNERRTPLFNGR